MAEAASWIVEHVARSMAEAEGWRWEDGPAGRSQMLDRAADLKARTNRERDIWRDRARVAIAAFEIPGP